MNYVAPRATGTIGHFRLWARSTGAILSPNALRGVRPVADGGRSPRRRSCFTVCGPVSAASGLGLWLLTRGSVAAPEDNTFREPPRGAGTLQGDARVTNDFRVQEGPQLSALVGVGYGLGVGARLGYAFWPGLYAGGAFTYYTGNATFVGGEVGYKLFINQRWELEPYAFVGAGFIREGDQGFGRSNAATVVALQPGFLGAYHFGPAFISAEARVYVAPSPGALAFFGGIGYAPSR